MGFSASPQVFQPKAVIVSIVWLLPPILSPKAHNFLKLFFAGYLSPYLFLVLLLSPSITLQESFLLPTLLVGFFPDSVFWSLYQSEGS